MCTEDKKVEKFKTIVETAEKYIVKHALKIINAVREKESNTCPELIKYKYKPKYKIEELEQKTTEEFNNIILEHFCIELQNQSGRTNAIKYNGQERKKAIYTIIKEFDVSQSNWCNLYEEFSNPKGNYKNYIIGSEKNKIDKIKFCNSCDEIQKCNKSKFNYGWKEYSKGLFNAKKFIMQIKKDSFIEELKEINKIDDYKNLDKKLKKIRNCYGIGTELSYDFYKELCCENLIKPDVHIKTLYNEFLSNKDKNIPPDIVAKDIISLCNVAKYEPYYIDKILWLCCTGNFYEENITINSMNREDFILSCK